MGSLFVYGVLGAIVSSIIYLEVSEYNSDFEIHERENDKRCYSDDPIVRDYARKMSFRSKWRNYEPIYKPSHERYLHLMKAAGREP